MSDIQPDQNFLRGLDLVILLFFLVGFIPGFYLALFGFKRLVKKPSFFAYVGWIFASFLIGLVSGWVSFWTILILNGFVSGSIGSSLQPLLIRTLFFHNPYWAFFLNNIPFVIILEVLLIGTHFFYSLIRRRKPVSQKRLGR